MCATCINYCQKVYAKISQLQPYFIGRVYFTVEPDGIRYHKTSTKTGKPYSKVIPMTSLIAARHIQQTQGLAQVNRKWHDQLPEGKNRGCNLKMIELILSTIK